MNKLFIVGLFLIGMLTMNIAGGLIIDFVKPVNVEIDYPFSSIKDELTTSDMFSFNNIDYEVVGNKIVLNKKDLFQNKEINILDQECLSWNDINGCVQWTNYSKQALIQKSIKEQIEFVQGVQKERLEKTIETKTDEGKILIK